MDSFRTLSLIEGCSLLALLFIAMPVNYLLGHSGMLFYVGMAHGVLFLAYVGASLAVSHKQLWSVGRWLFVFGLGVIPFGFLLLDKGAKRAEPSQTPVNLH